MPTITIPVVISEQSLGDILTTALEGGIGYWSFANKVKREDDLTITSVILSPCPDDEWGVFDDDRDSAPIAVKAADLAPAIQKILAADPPLCNAAIRDSIQHELMDAAAHPDYGCALDADGADVILQVHCFGKLVFG